ncbi:MAG: hypothetical protein MJ208_00740 [Bacilli bacterium]|nr:hypothetical protein [Bacilli bacterium]
MKEIKESFDQLIKNQLIKGKKYSKSNFGYRIKNKIYLNYFSNSCWGKFKANVRVKYGGGELDEHKHGKYIIPPKMASVASSSRFIYLLFKDKNNIRFFTNSSTHNGEIEFERVNEKITFKKGITPSKPNYDAFCESENFMIYFEAKCHEIFDNHSLEWKPDYKYVFPKKFKPLEFEYMTRRKNWLSFCKKHNWDITKPYKNKKPCCRLEDCRCIEMPPNIFNLDGEEFIFFDVKQFVCHLLGINARQSSKPAKLIYLYYYPESAEQQYNCYYKNLERQIKHVISSPFIKSIINKTKIELWYSKANTMEDKPILVKVF